MEKVMLKSVVFLLIAEMILMISGYGTFADEYSAYSNRDTNSLGGGGFLSSTGRLASLKSGTVSVIDTSITDTEISGSYTGNFNITNSGSMNYSLPIFAPQGRRGIEPDISFSYSSSKRSGGVLGVGFSLNSFSKITRCGKTLAKDGKWEGVKYVDSDFACLDGKRLVVVKGGYWQDRSIYRTEFDSLKRITYRRYISEGEKISYFRVEHPDGITFSTYGGTSNLNDGFKNSAFIKAKYDVRKEWPISNRDDKFGNYMIFEYYNEKDFCRDDVGCRRGVDYVTKEYHPYRISYTGNKASGDLPSRYVEFIYDLKPDVRTYYKAGHKTVSTRRVKSIGTVGPDNFLFRKYNFKYYENPVSHNSYLTSVEECAGDGVCKTPTVFEWSKTQVGGLNFEEQEAEPYVGLNGLIDENTASRYSSETIHDFYLVDLNGDGLKDILYASGTGLSIWSNEEITMGTWYYRLNESKNGLVEFSRDVKTDKDKDTRYRDWNEYYANRTNWQRNKLLSGLYFVNHVVYDFDSDGKEELISVKSHQNDPAIAKNALLIEQNSLENGKFAVKKQTLSNSVLKRTKKSMISDFNGDGKMELLVISWDSPGLSSKVKSVNLFLASYSKGMFSYWKNFNISFSEEYSPDSFRFLDIDNNGTVEVVGSNFDINFTGEDSNLTYQLRKRYSNLNFNPENKGQFTDLNGDGLVDFVSFSTDGKEMLCDINTGIWFKRSSKVCADFFEMANLDDEVRGLFPEKDFLFYDVTGNGKNDIIQLAVDSYKRREWATGSPKEKHAEDWLSRRFYLYENVSKKNLNEKIYSLFKKNGSYMKIDEHYISWQYDGINRNITNKSGSRLNLNKYFGDLNGDNIPDLIIPQHVSFDVSKSKMKIFINNTTGIEKIERIWEGLNSKQCYDLTKKDWIPEIDYSFCNTISWLNPTYSVEYEKGSNPGVYGTSAYNMFDLVQAVKYPARKVYPFGDLVKRYSVSNMSTLTSRSVSRRYFDLRYDTLNRHLLGFGAVVSKDEQTGRITEVFLDNHTFDENIRRFPFSGRVLKNRVITHIESNKYHAFERENSFETKINNNLFYSLIGSSRIEEYEYEIVDIVPNKTITINRVQSDYIYNNLGQLENKVTELYDGTKIENHVYYRNNDTNWCMSHPVFTKNITTKNNEQLINQKLYNYSNCNLRNIIEEPYDEKLYLKKRFTYDEYGNVVTEEVSDKKGNVRGNILEYDIKDHIYAEKISDLEGKVSTIEKIHPSLGVPKTRTDATGLVSKFAYDRFGRLRKTENPDGDVVETSYGYGYRASRKFNKIISETKRNGLRSDYSELWMGALGNIHFTKNSSFSKNGEKFKSQHTSYNEFGRLKKSFPPQFEDQAEYKIPDKFTEFFYDKFGRLTRVEKPDGNIITYEYSNQERGRVLVITDENGIRKIQEFDSIGMVVKSVEGSDPNGKTIEEIQGSNTKYIYGVDGNVAKIISPSSEIEIKYDKLGRKSEVYDPTRGVVKYEYNAFGNLVKEENSLGEEISYEYDSLGRMFSLHDKNGSRKWKFGENGMPEVLLTGTQSAWGHKENFEYDSLFRPKSYEISVHGAGNYKIAYDYDSSGNLEFVTYPDNHFNYFLKTKMQYDAFGNLEKISDYTRNKVIWEKTDEDVFGNTSNFKTGNGLVFHNSFNEKSERLNIMEVFRNNSAIKETDYIWDGAGNLKIKTNVLNGTSKSYSNDNLSRLRKVFNGSKGENSDIFIFSITPDEEYEYDISGNLVSRHDIGELVYDSANPNAVISANKKDYIYNSAGNMIKRGDDEITYTSFNLPSTIRSNNRNARFSYNSFNARVTKEVGNELTVYAGGLIDEKFHGNGLVTTTFNIYAEGNIIAQYKINQEYGTKFNYFINDHLGSVEMVRDENGNLVSEQEFDSFGKIKKEFSYTSIGFTGHEHDDEFDLINMKGRMFDPETGRFLTPDPIIKNPLSSQNYNPYSYVVNNPMTYIDPSGFSPCEGKPDCKYYEFDDDSVLGDPNANNNPDPVYTGPDLENGVDHTWAFPAPQSTDNEMPPFGNEETGPKLPVKGGGSSADLPLEYHQRRVEILQQMIGNVNEQVKLNERRVTKLKRRIHQMNIDKDERLHSIRAKKERDRRFRNRVIRSSIRNGLRASAVGASLVATVATGGLAAGSWAYAATFAVGTTNYQKPKTFGDVYSYTSTLNNVVNGPFINNVRAKAFGKAFAVTDAVFLGFQIAHETNQNQSYFNPSTVK